MALTPVVDREGWSGDGDLTAALLEALAGVEEVAVIKVEDAPASRADTGFNFIVNEVFVGFRTRRLFRFRTLFGVLPIPAIVHRKSLSLADLGARLSAFEHIGAPDYSDQGMLQYLRAQRVTAAYQRRGPKLVEMVRIYEAEIGSGRVSQKRGQ